MPSASKDELAEALAALGSLLSKCQNALPRLKFGTAQHTLLTRRIAALDLAISLLERESTK